MSCFLLCVLSFCLLNLQSRVEWPLFLHITIRFSVTIIVPVVIVIIISVVAVARVIMAVTIGIIVIV